jgi:hypothetical protein
MLVDLVAAVALTLALLLVLSLAARQYAAVRDIADGRRLLRLAAEEELARLRAGFPPRRSCEVSGWTHVVQLDVDQSPGAGDWSGFTLVTVRASQSSPRGRQLVAASSAYLPAPETRP